MKYTDQNNLPFIHKDTKKIIKNATILLVIKKNKYLLEYNNNKYICITNDHGDIYACYNLWS